MEGVAYGHRNDLIAGIESKVCQSKSSRSGLGGREGGGEAHKH